MRNIIHISLTYLLTIKPVWMLTDGLIDGSWWLVDVVGGHLLSKGRSWSQHGAASVTLMIAARRQSVHMTGVSAVHVSDDEVPHLSTTIAQWRHQLLAYAPVSSAAPAAVHAGSRAVHAGSSSGRSLLWTLMNYLIHYSAVIHNRWLIDNKHSISLLNQSKQHQVDNSFQQNNSSL